MSEQLRQEAIRLYESHQFAEAAQVAFQYVEQNPEDWVGLQVLADSCLLSGYLDEAERLFRHGAEHRESVFYLSGLATVLVARGDMVEAEQLLRKVIQRDPGNARAWTELASIHKFRKGDPLLTKLRRQTKAGDLAAETRGYLHYALCKALNDVGKWDMAWDQATRGAELMMPDYNPQELWDWSLDQRGIFDKDFLARRPGRGSDSEAPIFIVGLPRSGTTLVEMVITTTGKVTAMGELSTVPRVTAAAIRDDMNRGHMKHRHAWARRWRDEAFTEAAQFYLDDVARRAGGTCPERFVDKLPGNMFYLGEIALLFPNARIIRMHRHPLDTCASLYMGRFTGGHKYTFRPDWLAEAWLAYKDAGDHLTTMMPNPVLDVDYEAFVSDPEPQIRRLLDFLGLEWDPACLTPGGDGYTTITRSRGQVRSAINTRAVGRWRRYKNRIGPIAEALGIDIDDDEIKAA